MMQEGVRECCNSELNGDEKESEEPPREPSLSRPMLDIVCSPFLRLR